MMAIRLNQLDRGLLEALIQHQSAELAATGAEVTAAGVIRGLIRRAATDLKLEPVPIPDESPKPASKSKPKKK